MSILELNSDVTGEKMGSSTQQMLFKHLLGARHSTQMFENVRINFYFYFLLLTHFYSIGMQPLDLHLRGNNFSSYCICETCSCIVLTIWQI